MSQTEQTPSTPPPLPEPRGTSQRRFLSLLALAVLVALGLLLVRMLHQPSSAPAGDLRTWTKKDQKVAARDYLRAHVKVPGFKVDVVTINKGDNYWGMARSHGLGIEELVGYNLDMQHLNAYIGRELLLGNKPGTLHQVREGETTESIEKDYKLDKGSVRTANRMSWLGLRAGDLLFLPGAHPREFTPEMADLFEGRDFIRAPLSGSYSSMEGYRVDPFTGEKRLHNGVDIRAPFNALVAAAADGKVILAGWNGGFGKCIIIQHDNGFRTLYGHLNVILVHVGERVQQFQYIGKVGKTGRTTGAHLHFTVWKNDKLQNPLKYLW